MNTTFCNLLIIFSNIFIVGCGNQTNSDISFQRINDSIIPNKSPNSNCLQEKEDKGVYHQITLLDIFNQYIIPNNTQTITFISDEGLNTELNRHKNHRFNAENIYKTDSTDEYYECLGWEMYNVIANDTVPDGTQIIHTPKINFNEPMITKTIENGKMNLKDFP